jgi:hypothetical protein
MKKSIAFAVVSMALVFPVTSFAQFGNFLGGSKPASSSTGADLSGQQSQLTRTYRAAGKDVLTANGHIGAALGIKAQAINAAATSDSMSASDLEAQDKAISADAQAISDALKSGATLKDEAARKEYAEGLVVLVQGVKKYIAMSAEAQTFANGLSSASPMQLPGLQSGAYIVKSLPTSIGNLTGLLKNAVSFARSNGVAIPADATSVL